MTGLVGASWLDIRSLDIAIAVVDSGSMSETARRFGLTQSAVSQTVRKIEEELGAQLLHRDCRPLVPTNAGRVLSRHLRELNRDLSKAIDAARTAAALPEKVDIRLGLVDSFASTIGAHLFKELLDKKEAMRFSAWSGLAYEHSESLLRHAIDAAITSDSISDFEGITSSPICREPFLLLVPRVKVEQFTDLSLGEILDRHHLVRHSARSHMGVQVERHLRRVGLDPARILEFDTSDTLSAMVAIGNGVAITTPLCMLQGKAFWPHIVAVPLPGPGFSREILFATRRGEFEEIGQRILLLARNLIKKHVLPEVWAFAPWLAGYDMLVD